ncbi:MAG: hypothetical protein J7M09_05215, partial [Deltaproteobacteria bacterium]|nr:hypothetical protein [Candidatus Tharpella sp.]
SEIAKFLGKSRTAISNMLRLLNLPEKAQQCLAEEQLTMGHGRALLALPEGELQDRALAETLEKKLSVRELEKLVRRLKSDDTSTSAPVVESAELKEIRALQLKEDQSISQRLQKTYNTGIRIRRQASGRGRIELDFKSAEDFDELLLLLESRRA